MSAGGKDMHGVDHIPAKMVGGGAKIGGSLCTIIQFSAEVLYLAQ